MFVENYQTQPHPAYAAFTRGLTGHWSHILHTIPNISQHLSVLEDVIHQDFIPALTNRSSSTELERKIFCLPVRLGGLGLMNPAVCSDHIFQYSNKLTNSLVDLIVSQKISDEVDTETVAFLRVGLGGPVPDQLANYEKKFFCISIIM